MSPEFEEILNELTLEFLSLSRAQTKSIAKIHDVMTYAGYGYG